MLGADGRLLPLLLRHLQAQCQNRKYGNQSDMIQQAQRLNMRSQ